MPYLLHTLHPPHPPQATLLSRDELTGSLVQVRLLAITFEDGQGLMLLAVLANQPAMHYGWSWLCELRAACAKLIISTDSEAYLVGPVDHLNCHAGRSFAS